MNDKFTVDLANPANLGNYSNLVNLGPAQYLKTGVNLLFSIAGVASFIFLLMGGLQWITAGGDKEATEKARKRITSALIGLAIVLSAYALLSIISTLFGVTLLELTIPTIGK